MRIKTFQKITLAFFIILVFNSNILSQGLYDSLAPSEHFIYLDDATLLKKGEFTVKDGFLQTKYYDQSGEIISNSRIKFMRNDKGYYALLNSSPLPRVEKGYFDLFAKTERSTHYSSSSPYTTKKTDFYYSKGFGNLTRVNYNNLRKGFGFNDATSNDGPYSKVIHNLEKGKKRKKVSKITLIAGISTLLTGIILSVPNQGLESSPKTGALIISGVGLAASATAIMMDPEKFYVRSLREYNKIH